MPGVAECAVKDNRLIYVDIRGYQARGSVDAVAVVNAPELEPVCV